MNLWSCMYLPSPGQDIVTPEAILLPSLIATQPERGDGIFFCHVFFRVHFCFTSFDNYQSYQIGVWGASEYTRMVEMFYHLKSGCLGYTQNSIAEKFVTSDSIWALKSRCFEKVTFKFIFFSTWNIRLRIYLFIAPRRSQKTKIIFFTFVTGVELTFLCLLRPWFIGSSELICLWFLF